MAVLFLARPVHLASGHRILTTALFCHPFYTGGLRLREVTLVQGHIARWNLTPVLISGQYPASCSVQLAID